MNRYEATHLDSSMEIPFYRVAINDAEADEVAKCLRSGWLTTGPRVHQFETAFCAAVRAQHGIAVNSCTAAMHLAVEALGLRPGMGVLVPTMTFAATAEVVRYQGAVPILVDCDPGTLNMDLDDAERKLMRVRDGSLPIGADVNVCGIMPVHVGGLMVDMDAVGEFARRHNLWIVEDAAHAFPAAYQPKGQSQLATSGRKYGQRDVLLVLREQDHHNRRRGHGCNRRSAARRPHALHVVARTLQRCLEPVSNGCILGLQDRGARVQVQLDGHRGGDRNSSAGTRRRDASAA